MVTDYPLVGKTTQIGIICCKVPSIHSCVNEYPGIYVRIEQKEVLDFVEEKVFGQGKILTYRYN